MALNISDPQSLVNHINNSLNNSIDLNNSNSSSSNINAAAAASAASSTNGKKKRSYDFQNRKIRRRIWQEDEVHKLICVWATRLDDLRQSKKNRHIYEEISDELNSMGLDTIREEVHIKIQNLSQLYRWVVFFFSSMDANLIIKSILTLSLSFQLYFEIHQMHLFFSLKEMKSVASKERAKHRHGNTTMKLMNYLDHIMTIH